MSDEANRLSDEADRLRDAALAACERLGFHRAGIVALTPPRSYHHYQAWLASGYHGDMAYMEAPDHQRGRRDFDALLPGAKVAIVVALAYEPDPGEPSASEPTGRVARYAGGRDYHDVLKLRLRQLGADLCEAAGRDIEVRACVDSAPVLERDLAERAGLGFIGKNTMLITPGVGSYTVLGELLVAADIAPHRPVATASQHCGSCTACIDVCPTGAIVEPFVLDARRCISYLTIENRAAIEPALRESIGSWVFGCDECQDICPYNARAPLRIAPEPELRSRTPDALRPPLRDLVGLGSAQRRRHVKDSAMRRTSRVQLVRNAAVALGNTGDDSDVLRLREVADDNSAIVKEHAEWAANRLADKPAR